MKLHRMLLPALVLLVAAVAPARAAARTTLHVFAATSLLDAFDAIGKEFQKANPDVELRVQFAGSQTLAAQIEQGAEADVFASADDRWMRYLVERGHTDGEPREFARNGLVFIVPKSNPGRVGKVADAGRSGVKLVIGSDQVPVGAYTRLAVSKLAADPAFGEDFGRRVLRNVVSQEDNVKSIVNKVALGEADAGFVYRSDVVRGAARHVNAIELPASAQVVARYPIAALRTSNTELANRFIEFVLSSAGQSALRKEKFLPAS